MKIIEKVGKIFSTVVPGLTPEYAPTVGKAEWLKRRSYSQDDVDIRHAEIFNNISFLKSPFREMVEYAAFQKQVYFQIY